MQKEPISVSIRKILQKDISKNICSWESVARNGWAIKFSVYKSNILLAFVSIYTNQTIVRYFTCEEDAVEYINFVCEQNPQMPIEA